MNTSSLRSIQAVLAIGSFFLLTGAKGEGCGTSVSSAIPLPIYEPLPEMCPIGSHTVTICDDAVVISEEESTTSSSSGGFGTGGASSTGAGGFATTGAGPDEPPNPGSCHDECIPDDACPPGMVAQWACTNGVVDGPDSVVCEGDGCVEPSPCQLICVPAACPPGMHDELICGGEEDIDHGSSGSSSGSSGSSGGPGSGQELPYPSDCFNSCVPDECPIGTVPVTTCLDGCEGMSTCSVTCEPIGDEQGS